MEDTPLSPQEKDRYSRHLFIDGFGAENQERLKAASALIVGLGGLGSPVSMYLAAAGIGTLGLAEFDKVESHNLQRQILFSDRDIGASKAEVALDRLCHMNKLISVELHPEGLSGQNVTALIERYDVVVDCTDNFGTRYLLNDACYFARKPLVSGSVYQMEGQLWVLNPSDDGPCYRCLFPKPPQAGLVANCSESGVVGAVCGVIGSYQAMEVIKLLSGVGNPMTGKLLKIDMRTNRQQVVRVDQDHDCPLCGDNGSICDLKSEQYMLPCVASPESQKMNTDKLTVEMEIPVEQAKDLLETGDVLLLDIREQDEADICQIAGSRFIPMGILPEHASSLPSDQLMIVYCHHGFRSLRVVQYLRSIGFANCTSLQGGINRWADVVEPDMARY